MDKVYVFGHRNPDTDSVTAAISLSYLKNKLGINAVPAVLSSINTEALYALKYFNVPEPIFLNDIKLKVKDIDYVKNFYINEDESILDAFDKMGNISITKIPVVNKNRQLIGIFSMKDVAMNIFDNNYINSTYSSVMSSIRGFKITKFNNIVNGNLVITGKCSYNKQAVVIVDDENHIKNVINSNVNAIILVDNISLTEKEISLINEKRINVIKTKLSVIDTIKKICFCNKISSVKFTKDIISVNENDDISNFISLGSKSKFTYYPVVNNNGVCLGIVKYSNIGYYNKKKVILVDHNSYEQSAVGLNEADILEIIDHHNISNIGTTMPINFRNMPVGSTNTIIYLMYKENNVKISKQMAGMMLSGILSDTLILNSPTTTNIDRDAVNNLARICNVDYKEYGYNMISYGTRLDNKTKEEILYTDYKKYSTDDGIIGLGQIYTTDIQQIESEKDEYVKMLNDVCEHNDYKFIALFVTDFINKGTYVYYSDEAEAIFEKVFNTKMYEGIYIKGILSRKMQILPNILEVMK